MSRDNARTPMQWDASRARRLHHRHAVDRRSTPTTRRSTREAALADPDSVFHHYRRLIELRHTEPVVAHGDFTMLLPDDEQVYAFTRRLGDVELLVLGNFSGDTVPAELPDAAAGRTPSCCSATARAGRRLTGDGAAAVGGAGAPATRLRRATRYRRRSPRRAAGAGPRGRQEARRAAR